MTKLKLFKSAGNVVLKKINNTVNLAHLIDLLESQQSIADSLEAINKENEQEQYRKQLCREAAAACLNAMHDHIVTFLQNNRDDPTYENWIRAFHPDNCDFPDDRIDHRFYVQDSDHRIIWNGYVSMMGLEERRIEPRHLNPVPKIECWVRIMNET